MGSRFRSTSAAGATLILLTTQLTAHADPADCELGGGLLAGQNAVVSGDDFTLTPAAANDALGFAVARGDFDGDGTDDLATSAMMANVPGLTDTGVVYVFLDVTAHLLANATLAVSAADVVIQGDTASMRHGYSLAVGDVDGDGLDDLAIGAVPIAGAAVNSGEAHVVLGTTIAAATGPLVLPTASASEILGPNKAWSRFGEQVLLVDMTGDGKDDLVVSAMNADIGTTWRQGEVYVFPAPLGATLTAGVDERLRVEGQGVEPKFGVDLVDLGDVDGNGCDDVGIGAPWTKVGTRSGAGVFYLWHSDCLAGSTQQVVSASTAHALIQGPTFENEELGWSAALAGDVTGDGIDDLWIGARLGRDPSEPSWCRS